MEIPMPIKVTASVEATLSFESIFGDGTVSVSGPADKDKDGDPEFTVKVDLPGKALDVEHTVEIPFGSVITEGGPDLIILALKLIPVEFPFKSIVIDGVEAAVDALKKAI